MKNAYHNLTMDGAVPTGLNTGYVDALLLPGGFFLKDCIERMGHDGV
jgi:hypothetical protein